MATTTERLPPPVKKRVKLTLIDLLIFALVAAGVVYIAYRVESVLVYKWSWDTVLQFVVRRDEAGDLVPNLLVTGLLTTLRLAFWGTIAAAIIGLVMGLCRTSSNLFLRMVARLYVELIRNIPPVVFIFVFYFFISGQIMPLLGVDEFARNASPETARVIEFLFGPIGLFSNFLAGMICLAMFEGAYITEIVRAGIQSIEKGQWEAARAVGLSRFNVLRDVILPQAIRKILPPLAGQFITLVKDSAIVSLISIQELTFVAIEVAASTTRVFETWIVVGVMYFVVCYFFAVVFARLEKRGQRGRR
ncbi:amino acid ABC transporter permease [Pelagibius sp.]|uniref:amino acid ABC transporter permease n=1 Tax=Pelagibius sp. TaxID=1931238 RepID=UPI0026293F5D|nr:amino acid ABC transporter permease [Pelagibius sp.]